VQAAAGLVGRFAAGSRIYERNPQQGPWPASKALACLRMERHEWPFAAEGISRWSCSTGQGNGTVVDAEQVGGGASWLRDRRPDHPAISNTSPNRCNYTDQLTMLRCQRRQAARGLKQQGGP